MACMYGWLLGCCLIWGQIKRKHLVSSSFSGLVRSLWCTTLRLYRSKFSGMHNLFQKHPGAKNAPRFHHISKLFWGGRMEPLLVIQSSSHFGLTQARAASLREFEELLRGHLTGSLTPPVAAWHRRTESGAFRSSSKSRTKVRV